MSNLSKKTSTVLTHYSIENSLNSDIESIVLNLDKDIIQSSPKLNRKTIINRKKQKKRREKLKARKQGKEQTHIPSHKEAVDNAVKIATEILNNNSLKINKREKYKGIFGFHSIDGCRGKGSNEDTEIHYQENINQLGDIEVYGIFDGHSGIQTAKKMEKCAWDILKKNLIDYTNSPDDEEGIEEAFRVSQKEWLLDLPYNSGTTVLLVLIIKETWKTYNLCIGDSRFYYIDSKTGKNKICDIETLDYADETRKTYIGDSTNKIHHIIGPVVDKNTGKEISNESYFLPTKIKKCKENYDRYSFSSEYYWEEWVKWNENSTSNPSEYIVFPYKDKKAWRMKILQPSRSVGKNEKAVPLGVLYKIEIDPENTIACFGCDGIEDNGATNENNFGRFVVNFENANKEFFEGHIALRCMKDIQNYFKIPENNSDFLDKVEWMAGTINEGCPLSFVDKDYKYGIQKAEEYFTSLEDIESSLKDQNPEIIAKNMCFLCSIRFSADNVTVGIVKFQ